MAWYQAKFPAPEGAVRDAGQVFLVLQDLRDVCQVGLVPDKVPSPGRGRQGRRLS
ncbi:hypothetical protein N425_08785 [Tannerella sp. oral taxon BU063 isolate Cell 2]|uniref:Uncharacterized protein n=1 Tax=Tannerella sp. oral taxon BU063 isolate Cell 2 TaxID=1411148 RepID=W2C3I8_9BACT|nr:hypothetical protein N425_08785 [Tannerella sp. oral taxon BU063 isolate Cell 2]